MSTAARRAAALLAVWILCASVCSCSTAPTVTRGFAMDTEYTVTVYGDDGVSADVVKAITRTEQELSWSVEDSAVSALNRDGTVTGERLARTVECLLPIVSATGGEFSLLMRPLCELWNVTGENPVVPDADRIAERLALCSGRVTVDGDTVSLPDGGEMDLGAVGKGVACDEAYRLMQQRGASGVIAVGGSVVVCGEKPSGGAWKIAVADPADRNRTVGVLSLEGGRFVSTSGNGERYFEADGVRYHHIISGVTGWPCRTGLDAVTVVCSSGVLADALSTACFLLGYEDSLPLLEAYGAQAVFFHSDGTQTVTEGLRGLYEVTE